MLTLTAGDLQLNLSIMKQAMWCCESPGPFLISFVMACMWCSTFLFFFFCNFKQNICSLPLLITAYLTDKSSPLGFPTPLYNFYHVYLFCCGPASLCVCVCWIPVFLQLQLVDGRSDIPFLNISWHGPEFFAPPVARTVVSFSGEKYFSSSYSIGSTELRVLSAHWGSIRRSYSSFCIWTLEMRFESWEKEGDVIREAWFRTHTHTHILSVLCGWPLGRNKQKPLMSATRPRGDVTKHGCANEMQ